MVREACSRTREVLSTDTATFTLIHARNPGPFTGAGTNTYLIPGRRAVLIDAGIGHPDHLAELARILMSESQTLNLVLVTHGHVDHVSGVAALATEWPEAVFAKCPWPERDQSHPVNWTWLADGQTIETDHGVLRVLHTPGHAPDHLCFLHEPSGTVFTGDLVVANGTVVIPSDHGGDLAAYLASLERLRALAPTRLLPGHGAPIDEPAALLTRYLSHRQQREDQILSRLSRGHTTVADLVRDIYDDVREDLWEAARQSATAHLIKLENEGRVQQDGLFWSLVESNDD